MWKLYQACLAIDPSLDVGLASIHDIPATLGPTFVRMMNLVSGGPDEVSTRAGVHDFMANIALHVHAPPP